MWGDKLSFKTEILGTDIHWLILISYGCHEQNHEHTTQSEEFYGYMTFFLWMTKIHHHELPLGFTALCTGSPFQNGFQTASDLTEGRKPMKPKKETVPKHFTQ